MRFLRVSLSDVFNKASSNSFLALVREVERRVEATTSPVLRYRRETDRALFLAYLHTGGKRDEVLRWRWEDDIDLKGRKLRLSTNKTATGEVKREWRQMSAALKLRPSSP